LTIKQRINIINMFFKGGVMNILLKEKMSELKVICRKFDVKELY